MMAKTALVSKPEELIDLVQVTPELKEVTLASHIPVQHPPELEEVELTSHSPVPELKEVTLTSHIPAQHQALPLATQALVPNVS